MPRRRDDSILRDLFSTLLLVPWWMGPILAGIAFASFTWLVPWLLLSAIASDNLIHRVPATTLTKAAPGIAPLAAGVVLVLWVVAECQKLRRRKLLDRQSGIDSIRALSWQQFEQLLAEAFHREGYVVDHLGQAGPDGGIDLRLRRNGRVTLVQCKHWRTQQVGVRIVRELLGVVASEKADSGIVVTSGVFTRESLAFAEKNSIRLIDGQELSHLIQHLQPATQVKLQTIAASPDRKQQPTRPACPRCQSPMVQRTASRGPNSGSQFWGCSQYPRCKGIRDFAVVN